VFIGQSRPSAQELVVLHPSIKAEALPLISDSDYLGLGAEARRLDAWIRDHRAPFHLSTEEMKLAEQGGRRIGLSPGMTLTLVRLGEWYGLVATETDPITHEQLRAGALSEASIERIRALFENSIRRGVRVGERWLTPEVGGEATLDSELRLEEAPDPRWAVARELAHISDDPSAVATLVASRPLEVAQVDPHGLLKGAVLRLGLGTTSAPAEVRRAVATIVLNAAPTYSLGPEEQFALVAGRNWNGRYVGGWHTHAPHESNGVWAGSDAPSFEDMENAVRAGQFLTLSFQPDGFDLYDAGKLADEGRVDLSLLLLIRYRSPSWREHFKKLVPVKR
jgi:hypothetical protein